MGALLLVAATPATAQENAPVYFDGSLGFEGPAHSIPDIDGAGVEYQIDYCPNCGLDTHPFGSQGKLVNSSLFHSLRDIDVPADDAARFAVSEQDVSVDYVFARITSGQETQFDGALRSDLGADIYLLNPYGVMFGAGSQIDVNGTFYVSTADEVRFDDEKTFETRAGGLVPMIEVGNPSSFGFLLDDEPPARILFDSDGGLLSNEPGRSLTAVAGRIEIDDEVNPGAPAKIVSNGGQIKLAAVPAGADVPVDVESVNVDELASDDAVVRMSRNAHIEVRDAVLVGDDLVPARIVIRAGRFEMVQPTNTATTALIRARETGAGSTDPPAIDVEVAGTISLAGGQIQSVSDDDGPGGNIRLVGETIELLAGADIDSRLRRNNVGVPGPDIFLKAGTVSVSGGSTIRSRFSESGTAAGKVGDITVLASQVTVSGPESAILTTSQGTGNGATIHVEAIDVTVKDDARITAKRLPSSDPSDVPEDAGGIEILAVNLSVSGRAEINSATSTNIDGASIQIGTFEEPVTKLTITDGFIGTVTTAEGAGGNVDVHAESIVLNRTLGTADVNPQISALTTRNESGGGGNGPGGNLTIQAGSVELYNGSQFRATTQGDAPGGILTVVVDGLLSADGAFTPPPTPENPDPDAIPSGIFAKSELSPDAPGTPTTGQGGTVNIAAQSVILTAGAEFSAGADSVGNAGNLDLVADTVLVEGDPETNATSTISVLTTDGSGGNLAITTDRLQVHNQGIVTASTSGIGDSGNLTVMAREIDIAGEGSGVFAQSNFENIGAGRAGAISLTPPDGERLTLRVRDGAKLSVKSDQNAAGVIEITDAALIEVTNGGEISASVTNVDLREGEEPGDLASDIRIVNANTVRINQGTMTAETNGNGVGGTIDIDATSVELIDSTMTARALRSGAGGSIDIDAASVELIDSTMTAQTLRGGAGGSIEIDAVDIQMTGGTMTAETSGAGQGGSITVQADQVDLSNGAQITASSVGTTSGAGDAGAIVIAATGTFSAKDSEITTTAGANDAGGGRISIQARNRVYFLDSLVETTVKGLTAGADAGDIFIPLGGEETVGVDPVVPEFVVINRSVIRANAVASGAGDITIDGRNVLISSDSLIEAHSEEGVSGEIQISSPDADIASQVAQLPSSFVDPSDRLLPPCVARTERTGSFMVRNREALPRSLDAPLPSTLGGAAGGGRVPPASGSTNCSVFQERS
jgi:filamentous hemagglutinin family protein